MPDQDDPLTDPGVASLYLDYIHLPDLLGVITPRTEVPEERHFLVATQVMELLFAVVAADWQRAREQLRAGDLSAAAASVRLADRAWQTLLGVWPLVGDLAPEVFASFRPRLGAASGFHSYGFRLLELLAGHKEPAVVETYAGLGALEDVLRAELAADSLDDEARAALASKWPAATWQDVFGDGAHPLHELATELARASDRMRSWRELHLAAVSRALGDQPGTAGSAGARWLAGRSAPPLFPELVAARG